MKQTTIKTINRQAKALDLDGKDELYEYILDSKINGNYTQVAALIKALPKEAKKDFLHHCDNNCNNNNVYVQEAAVYCKSLTIEMI